MIKILKYLFAVFLVLFLILPVLTIFVLGLGRNLNIALAECIYTDIDTGDCLYEDNSGNETQTAQPDKNDICAKVCADPKFKDVQRDCFIKCMGGVDKKSYIKQDVACTEYKYPWCGGEKTDIAGLIKKFYNYALAAVGVAALGAIIFGGIKYTVSAGNPSGQADAISWITGAVWGLVLLLGANLLLRTINPKLTKLELGKLKPVEIIAPVSESKICPINQRWSESFKGCVSMGLEDVKSIPNIVGGLNPRIYSDNLQKIEEQKKALLECDYNCTVISSPNSQYYLPNIKEGACQGSTCSVNPDIAKKLDNLYDSRATNWQITEAWPPTVSHSNPCHYNGTCVDTNFKDTNNVTAKKITSFIDDANKQGLRAVYEVKTQGEVDKLIKDGVPANNIAKVEKITAPHFSVYNK